MQTAIIVNARFIGNQILQILEPIPIKLNSIVKVIIEEQESPPLKKRIFGCAKDWIEFSKDFDEPLEELKEYKFLNKA